MQFYDYIYRDSVIHALDPRTKLAWLFGLSLLVFLTDNPAYILGVAAFVVVAVVLSKLPLKAVWDATKVFVVGFTVAYMALFSLLLWDVQQGVTDGFFFSMKFLVLIVSSVVFAMSTSPRDLMLSLTKLKVPFEFAFMLTLAIRFVPVITREINHVINAQKTRGHTVSFSLRRPVESLKTFLPVLIPTFHLLLIKAFNLSLSIEARAFRAKETRTYPPRLSFGVADYASLILLLIVFPVVAGWVPFEPTSIQVF